MPSYQGSLDGLCGPYAVANALELCDVGTDHEALFRIACSVPALSRWPDLLWSGTTFGDLQRMIRACLEEGAPDRGIRVSYPFLRSSPKSNADYWSRFDTVFDDETVVCGIVGLIRPHAHWIVVSRSGRRLQFVDSSAEAPFQRKNRGSLFAGLRARYAGQWLIDRRELVTFRRTGSGND